MRKITLFAKDGYRLSLRDYEISEPKAVVQIAHGMEEHQLRYKEIAEYLNSCGFAVVTADMRGHGADAPVLGHFADKDGWKLLVSDMIGIRKYISKVYPDKPVYLLAHSMGTIISRVMLQKHSHSYEKVVLTGYPNAPAALPVALALSESLRTVCGPTFRSAVLREMTTGVFNKAIKNPRTGSDWLSNVPENVDRFLADPLCGQGFTAAAYGDLYALVEKMSHPERYTDVNADMRILMLRGTDDPATGGNKGAEDSRRVLREAGFGMLAYIDYEGMRHELLSEKDSGRVRRDISDFFLS